MTVGGPLVWICDEYEREKLGLKCFYLGRAGFRCDSADVDVDVD